MQRIRCRCRNFLVPRISFSFYFTFSIFLCNFFMRLCGNFSKANFPLWFNAALPNCLARFYANAQVEQRYIYKVHIYIYYVCVYLTSQSQAAKFCNCLAGSLGDWQLSSLPDATRLRGISENVEHKLTNCCKGEKGGGEEKKKEGKKGQLAEAAKR